MDNIVVYGDKDGVVFRSRHEYKLEKTGIPAYKLIVEEGGYVNEKLIKVENSQYVIIMNSVATGGCVGLLITLNIAEIVFNKDQTVFRVVSDKIARPLLIVTTTKKTKVIQLLVVKKNH
ncbi:MAG: tip-20 [Betabaculovirus sp.]|nr:MAG: tip-20 [Betabaculovirus sp.]